MKFKVIPTCGCHRHVRRERLLGEISGTQLPQSGVAGFPTLLTLHLIGAGGGIVQADAA